MPSYQIIKNHKSYLLTQMMENIEKSTKVANFTLLSLIIVFSYIFQQ